MTETEVDPAPEIRVEHVGLSYETRNGTLEALAGCSLAVPGGLANDISLLNLAEAPLFFETFVVRWL